jgi:hypothetical protein
MRRRWLLYSALVVAIWVFTYCIDSLYGGYILVPETIREFDVHRQRVAYKDVVINWYPRFGRFDGHTCDAIGFLYSPLIRCDRRFFHKSISLLDNAAWARVQHLPKQFILKPE